MPTIIQGLPFFDQPISVQRQPVRIFPWQIVLWVSVAPKGLSEDSSFPCDEQRL
jgi:hypothetical protein